MRCKVISYRLMEIEIIFYNMNQIKIFYTSLWIMMKHTHLFLELA